jgi:hypothetical protein
MTVDAGGSQRQMLKNLKAEMPGVGSRGRRRERGRTDEEELDEWKNWK